MSALLLAALLGTAVPGDAINPSAEPEVETTRWYGWQTLLFDAGSAGLGYLAVRTQSNILFGAGAALYVFGAPIVNGAHGNEGRGGYDLLMRVLIPITGAAVGFAVSNCHSQQASESLCGVSQGLIGGLSGAAAASLIDAIFLAHEEVPPSRVRLLPTVSFYKGRDGTAHPAAALVASF